MAHTDDIAEKVVDLLVDQTARAATTGLDVGKQLAQGAGVLTQKALEKLLKKSKEDKELHKLLGVEGEITPAQMTELVKKLGLKSSTVRVANSDSQEYETLLRQNRVMYAKMNIKDDNAKMFIFLNQDREKIQNVATILQANRGMVTEVKPDLYFNQLAPENVRLVDGLDRAEMELFRHYARYESLLFTAIRQGDKYSVVFENKDEPKARKALLHVGWDLTGFNGARNREQIEYRLKGRTAVNIAIETGERDVYVVSKNRPQDYIAITDEDLSIYKQGKKLSTVSRSHPDFYTRCMSALEGMEGGVILTENQFRTNLTREELEDYRTIDLFDRQYDELMEMDHQNSLIDLVAMKSSLDDDHDATWGLWDPSVSYSEFSGYEFFMDDEEREAREVEFEHFKKAAYYAQDNYAMQDVHLDEKNVDFIIMKAEEKRKAQSGPDRSRGREEKEPERPTPMGL